ncbi:MAG: nucleotidyltransferase domain-containing protein [Armatimonadetes bacterium]|nr:nucleotidyltransferase domain-containing protein [Armatimonadota bacterium]
MDRDAMIALSREAALAFVEGEPEFIAAYLTGSVATGRYLDEPDIDIMVVRDRPTVLPGAQQHVEHRGAALELAYRTRSSLEDAESLLAHPVLAAEVATAVPLWDPQGFLRQRQAFLQKHWQEPAWREKRARSQWHVARELLLLARDERGFEETAREAANDYIRFLLEASSIFPVFLCRMLTYRRSLLLHREACDALGRPDLHAGLLSALCASAVGLSDIEGWIRLSHEAGDRAVAISQRSAQEEAAYRSKKRYYDAGFRDLQAGGHMAEAVLPLLMVNGLYVDLLLLHDTPEEASRWESRWQAMLETLGLWPPDRLGVRMACGGRFLEAAAAVIGAADG